MLETSEVMNLCSYAGRQSHLSACMTVLLLNGSPNDGLQYES